MTLTASLTQVVGGEDTAASFGTHFPRAAATPFVLGIAEVACHNAIAPELADGEVTVGMSATIEHLLPSPVGATLTARATLDERNGRRLQFSVEVFDGDELAAKISHGRAIVSAKKIEDRLADRAAERA